MVESKLYVVTIFTMLFFACHLTTTMLFFSIFRVFTIYLCVCDCVFYFSQIQGCINVLIIFLLVFLLFCISVFVFNVCYYSGLA